MRLASLAPVFLLLALLPGCAHRPAQESAPARSAAQSLRATNPPPAAPFTYFASAPDPASAIPDAITRARQSERHVLLVFGADWCSDSRAMIRRLTQDPRVASRLAASYLLVPIDVGERNGPLWDAEVVQRYDRPFAGRGIPALVVLDALGNQLTDASNNPLRDSSHRHPRRLAAFLDRWAPPSPPPLAAPGTGR